ncbi:Hydroxyneurosporene synthase-domain-containing protein [Aspergillus filifer]
MSFMKLVAKLVTLAHFSTTLAYVFTPDTDLPPVDPRLPVLYDIVKSQTFTLDNAPLITFSFTSYLTTTTGEQFFFTAAISASESLDTYGFSMLDLGSLERTWKASITTFTRDDLASFNISQPNFDIAGIPPDRLSMTVQAHTENMSLDLTVHATSRAFYYGGGSGTYMFVDTPGNEWQFPAMKTSGTLSLLEPPFQTTEQPVQRMQIDPSASLSWYTRYWGAIDLHGGNSTSFNLLFHDTGLVLGSYFIDSINPPFHSRSVDLRFRHEAAQALVPVDVFEPDMKNTWTSPRTGIVYPQRWDLGIEGRGILHINSIVGGQENSLEVDGTGPTVASYIGFVTFDGSFDGSEVSGFGLVQLNFPVSV